MKKFVKLDIYDIIYMKVSSYDNTAARVANIAPPGCHFFHQPWLVGRSDHFKIKLHSHPASSSFE